MASTARTVIFMRDKGQTRFCCQGDLRYQIGTTLTETVRHAMEKPKALKVLIVWKLFPKETFRGVSNDFRRIDDHGAVNRLVDGSNPSRGAKLNQRVRDEEQRNRRVLQESR